MTDETRQLIEAEKNAPPVAVCPVAEKSVQGEPILNIGDGIEVIRDNFKNGKMTANEAGLAYAETIAAGKAVDENIDTLSKIKGREYKQKFIANEKTSRTRNLEATNNNNEAFYKKFRPIFEFDFSHITGKEQIKNVAETESKSYSILFMVLTLITASWLWLAISTILYFCKGVNAVTKLLAEFTKQARILIISGFLLFVLFIILQIISKLIEFYTGVKILPT